MTLPATSQVLWQGLAFMVGLPLAVGVATIVLGIGASGLLTLAGTAADVLVDPTAYLTAVSR